MIRRTRESSLVRFLQQTNGFGVMLNRRGFVSRFFKILVVLETEPFLLLLFFLLHLLLPWDTFFTFDQCRQSAQDTHAQFLIKQAHHMLWTPNNLSYGTIPLILYMYLYIEVPSQWWECNYQFLFNVDISTSIVLTNMPEAIKNVQAAASCSKHFFCVACCKNLAVAASNC